MEVQPEGLKAVYGQMNASPITLTSWTDTSLKGSITAEDPGVMYTSIPYDKGWTITVDGAEVTRESFSIPSWPWT